MTPEEKQAECNRICGPHYSEEARKRGFHTQKSLDLDAPDTCPIMRDLMHKPKRRRFYEWES